MTANKPMTGEQLDELMTVAVNMQRDAETDCNRPSAMFAYAVQVAVLELRKVRNDASALAAENAGMDSFVDALLSIAWQGGSADGAEIQELALKHGLLRQEVYSADEHETLVDDPGNFEDGDPVYFRVETPATDAFLAEVRAQGVDMFALMFAEEAIKTNNITTGWRAKASRAASEYAEALREEAAQLRKGVQS
ncbi:hypothetical protein N8Q82_18585 [Enterobacter roggenkampii]|uniref:hypothetical protein n=1 Tax=Enterobacter roggenkampii TaxID=1812935 RepID=UPI0021C9A32B|nr:hypothetical protein [Enterobacter roggenkampii]MCU2347999.1 hypothetical protein [Enterobacter roggenkampii]